jgi:hypothetical protein
MEQLGSHWTDFHEILYFDYLSKLTRKFKIHCNLTRITGTLDEDFNTFFISRSLVLRMRNVSKKSCRGNQNTFYVH